MSAGKTSERAAGRARRRKRVRKKIRGTAERPRLAVFRSNRNISCQVIDDVRGVTMVSASTLEKELWPGEGATKTESARALGEAIARRARERGIEAVVFDRGGYMYHGRVSALADAARENGLKF